MDSEWRIGWWFYFVLVQCTLDPLKSPTVKYQARKTECGFDLRFTAHLTDTEGTANYSIDRLSIVLTKCPYDHSQEGTHHLIDSANNLLHLKASPDDEVRCTLEIQAMVRVPTSNATKVSPRTTLEIIIPHKRWTLVSIFNIQEIYEWIQGTKKWQQLGSSTIIQVMRCDEIPKLRMLCSIKGDTKREMDRYIAFSPKNVRSQSRTFVSIKTTDQAADSKDNGVWIGCKFEDQARSMGFQETLQQNLTFHASNDHEGKSSNWHHEGQFDEYIVSASQHSADQENYNKLRLIRLEENSGDYKWIRLQFMETIGSTQFGATIDLTNSPDSDEEMEYFQSRQSTNSKIAAADFKAIIIYKIEHKARGDAHDDKRKQILRSLGGDVSKLHEGPLYHGTRLDLLPKILHQGFLRQFADRTKYGKGMYFARNAGYSSNPKYAKPDDDGFQHLLLCNVICGMWAKGDSTMKVPPPKKDNAFLPHETTVDDVRNPSIFVTYQDDQALPVFLISFKRT